MDSEDYIPPQPVEYEDGTVGYPTDPNFEVTVIPEQDIRPVEVDDDYSPTDEEDFDNG